MKISAEKPRSASEVADALECYRMKSERQRENCKNKSCHYNNNDPHYGCWCCSNSILHDAVAMLTEQEPVKPIPPTDESDLWRCGNCNYQLFRCTHQRYCEMCGKQVKWDE